MARDWTGRDHSADHDRTWDTSPAPVVEGGRSRDGLHLSIDSVRGGFGLGSRPQLGDGYVNNDVWIPRARSLSVTYDDGLTTGMINFAFSCT